LAAILKNIGQILCLIPKINSLTTNTYSKWGHICNCGIFYHLFDFFKFLDFSLSAILYLLWWPDPPAATLKNYIFNSSYVYTNGKITPELWYFYRDKCLRAPGLNLLFYRISMMVIVNKCQNLACFGIFCIQASQ
jgi:hypothetical protein